MWSEVARVLVPGGVYLCVSPRRRVPWIRGVKDDPRWAGAWRWNVATKLVAGKAPAKQKQQAVGTKGQSGKNGKRASGVGDGLGGGEMGGGVAQRERDVKDGKRRKAPPVHPGGEDGAMAVLGEPGGEGAGGETPFSACASSAASSASAASTASSASSVSFSSDSSSSDPVASSATSFIMSSTGGPSEGRAQPEGRLFPTRREKSAVYLHVCRKVLPRVGVKLSGKDKDRHHAEMRQTERAALVKRGQGWWAAEGKAGGAGWAGGAGGLGGDRGATAAATAGALAERSAGEAGGCGATHTCMGVELFLDTYRTACVDAAEAAEVAGAAKEDTGMMWVMGDIVSQRINSKKLVFYTLRNILQGEGEEGGEGASSSARKMQAIFELVVWRSGGDSDDDGGGCNGGAGGDSGDTSWGGGGEEKKDGGAGALTFIRTHKLMLPGDRVAIQGRPGVSRQGAFSLIASRMELLRPHSDSFALKAPP